MYASVPQSGRPITMLPGGAFGALVVGNRIGETGTSCFGSLAQGVPTPANNMTNKNKKAFILVSSDVGYVYYYATK